MPYSLKTIPGAIESKTKEYNAWLNMRQRCNNKNHHKYHIYGARGIRICEDWRVYVNFLRDMGRAPTAKHQLDRINVNLGYSTNNCRWALPETQAINKRILTKNKSGIAGVHFCQRRQRWITQAQRFGKKQCLYNGLDFFEAVCTIKSLEAREKP